MNSSQILQGKNAIIFGAGGSIGSAVAKEFAAEGAEVFLSGRTKSNVEMIAEEITQKNRLGHAEVIDALDEKSVNKYLSRIANDVKKIDIVFNAMGPLAKEYGNTKKAVDLTVEEFMIPLRTIVMSQFITASAAARIMIKQQSGVIIFLTGSPARGHTQGATAIGTAFGAIETMSENLAFQLGLYGVRVVCLRITANFDSRTIEDSWDLAGVTKESGANNNANLNFLKKPMSVKDTAKAAVLIASDRASFITGTVVNSSAGAALD